MTTPYRAPLDDILFTLEHVADLSAVAALPGHEDQNAEMAGAVLEEAARLAEKVLAPLNRVGDSHPTRLENGRVMTPPGFKEAFAQYRDGGWPGIGADPAFGGQGFPHLVATAVGEMWKAANLALSSQFLLNTGAIEALQTHGSDDQKARFLGKLIAGEWGGVMNLTEPQAGSDLSAIRTRAVPQADGTYRLFGQKVFITYADNDLVDNVVHLVLARLPDAAPGVKGISMFLASRSIVDANGRMTEPNDIEILSLEKKMGQHASPTCSVVHGSAGRGATAELIGEPGRGLEYIFVMVNSARLGVALEGLGVAERALQHAEAYAASRVQGRTAAGTSATIDAHPDVRRMLKTMRAQTEAMRGVAYVIAGWLDIARHDPDEERRQLHQGLVDTLIPVLKGWMTETGTEVSAIALQVHGGAGYIDETGVSQYYRDIRVACIYEGTTGIQAADLVGRKLRRKPGPAPILHLVRMIRETAEALDDVGDLAGLKGALGNAVDDLARSIEYLLGHADAAQDEALDVSVPFLMQVGIVLGAWQLACGAAVATRGLESDSMAFDTPFLARKIDTARFYYRHILPAAGGLAVTVRNSWQN